MPAATRGTRFQHVSAMCCAIGRSGRLPIAVGVLLFGACTSGGRPPRPTPPGDTCPPGRNLVCYDKEAPDSGAVLNDRFCRCEQVLNIP